MILYLQGSPSVNGEQIHCSLSTSVVMYLLRYCQTETFEIVFVPDSDASDSMCSTLSRSIFSDLSVTFKSWSEVPILMRNVALPSLHQPELSLVRSGLCVLLRHIITDSHTRSPELDMIDLLGFRQGSMKMCSEVSGFTKLCEVELPQQVSHLMSTLNDTSKQNGHDGTRTRQVILPNALSKLNCHFIKECRVHNDNKRRREELLKMKKYFSESIRNKTLANGDKSGKSFVADTRNVIVKEINLVDSCGDATRLQNGQSIYNYDFVPSKHSVHIHSEKELFGVEIEKLSNKDCRLQIDHVTRLHHGIRRLKVDKYFGNSLHVQNGESVEKLVQDFADMKCSTNMKETERASRDSRPDGNMSVVRDVAELVQRLTYVDVQYEHTYSEGIEMTLADLILYVYIYNLLEALNFSCISLAHCVPSILQWASHMTSLDTVTRAGERSGWNMKDLAVGLTRRLEVRASDECSSAQGNKDAMFVWEVEVLEEDDDEMELSRCARMKHKALKPEITQTLLKFEMAKVNAVTGEHSCGDHVEVEWDSLPAAVHPKEGDVPESRMTRKCQQLENLVTAVQRLAQAGNILVDFCSGGGHLGILMAYMLPDCQVYLVENKEDSLLKACSRLESLALTNVTLFQCNLDYFSGSFDIGVCLHACGSATDMVLQLCLNSHASFVICPCCYGSIQRTHLLSYPQSKQFMEAGISYKDFLTLGHAADQTELNIALEEQGHLCMDLVDTDRAQHARELGYSVTLCSLKPLSCTPKNNLLIGALKK